MFKLVLTPKTDVGLGTVTFARQARFATNGTIWYAPGLGVSLRQRTPRTLSGGSS